ncbi:cysteine desulfurase [Alsobacter soli]|uniref:Cysteine desulfurase n=1 Tax=Alsobacter soli TaxID=2109933 RepID=A0A2T1HVU6_9HYPH|nr:cysteine desulfurase family protein [Alsobacter soli]PSC05784.1 cysteine desulfurase [Alsobacter soli]
MSRPPRSYLDHNATSDLRPEAREAMLAALDAGGNASSVHAEGRAARGRIEAAREEVAALAGCAASRIVFTSGGTEANVLALTPFVERCGERQVLDRLLTTAVEHPCVLEGARFPSDRIERIPVTADGVVDLAWLGQRLATATTAGERVMASVQAANNETGVVQPVRAAADLVHVHDGVLHCDAVQALGKTGFSVAASGADLVALSAHKIGGPQGVGALVVSGGLHIADRVLRGGGQERGARAGTENGPGVAGFGAAAKATREAGEAERGRIRALRDRLEIELLTIAPEAVIFGGAVERLPNTTLFALPGLRAETALIAFDLEGVALSSGSACSSGKVKRSHVLEAMGVSPDLCSGAIRVSLGWSTEEADVIRFLGAFEKLRKTLHKRLGRAAA